MKSTITTNTYYKNDMIIKETIVDGDIFEIVEQYLDENGDLIYEYKHDYSSGKLLKIHEELIAQTHDIDYYGAKGVMKQIDIEARKKANEAKQKEKELRIKKEKNKAQYNKKLNKKLEKNRKRG